MVVMQARANFFFFWFHEDGETHKNSPLALTVCDSSFSSLHVHLLAFPAHSHPPLFLLSETNKEKATPAHKHMQYLGSADDQLPDGLLQLLRVELQLIQSL